MIDEKERMKEEALALLAFEPGPLLARPNE
jgi:hypothetical protein